MHTDPQPTARSGDGILAAPGPHTRRTFLRSMALGGAVLLMPGLVTACSKDDKGGLPFEPGGGDDISFDLGGDTGLLRFAYAAEQLRADYYLHIVPFLDDGAYTDTEQFILTDVKYHHVMHREFLKASLGSNADFTLQFTYGSLDFANRAEFLATARALEVMGVSMYNGLAQYFTSGENLVTAAKLASVQARHASAIGVMIDPSANAFAPLTYGDVARPTTAEAAVQAYVMENLTLTNTPAAFAPGPNGNG